jgi:hypothetical protein
MREPTPRDGAAHAKRWAACSKRQALHVECEGERP